MTEITPKALEQLRKDKPEIPPAYEAIDLDLVPLISCFVDDRYQRRVSQGSMMRIRRILRDFTWARFGAITVARTKDNGYAVIDGQHRVIAARTLGIADVPAVIVSGDTADQAADFVGINTTRTSVATIDKFRARVASGDETACEVAELLSRLDISTDVAAGTSLQPRQTRAVTLLEKMIKRIGAGEVYTTLEILLDAQPDQKNLLTAFAIDVCAMTLHRVVMAEGDINRLADRIAVTDFESLRPRAATISKQKGGGAKHSVEGASLLLQDYNRGLQKKIA
jgi:hypothetical protein